MILLAPLTHILFLSWYDRWQRGIFFIIIAFLINAPSQKSGRSGNRWKTCQKSLLENIAKKESF